MADRAEDAVRRILGSAKYRHLDEALVRRVATEAVARFRDQGEATKYAKRKLHQAFGAFLTGAPARAVSACVDRVLAGEADAATACRAAMAAHASTAERLDHLAALYDQVAAWCGGPASVADLACGLNPLAVPWMRLAPGAAYWCCDIDTALMAALGRLGEILPVEVTAATCDLVAAPPAPRAELVLLLKTVSTLEQQRPGAANRLLAGLDCPHVVLSLPRRSLSARRAYANDPHETLRGVLAGTGYRADGEAAFGAELVFHLVPGTGPGAAAPARGAAGPSPDSPDPGPGPKPGPKPGAGPDSGPGAAPQPAGSDPAGGGGELRLVGTPIGNLGDLTAGALAALRAADVVCAEDTRRTRKLLSAYDLHPPRLVSVRAHNEQRESGRVTGWVGAGRRVAVVTDAGMPGISDPGARLAHAVDTAGGRVAVAPGPDAATTALAVSGLACRRWCFEGFLPARGAERARRLAAVAAEPRTVVVYEAPHRLVRTLDDLAAAGAAGRPAAVANDLTKRFERVWRGTLAEVADQVRGGQPRGEFVLVLGAPN